MGGESYLTALWTKFLILSVSWRPTIRFSTLPSFITISTGTEDTSKSSAISVSSSMSTYKWIGTIIYGSFFELIWKIGDKYHSFKAQSRYLVRHFEL